MAGRDTDTHSESSFGVQPVNVSHQRPLPEQWTLPHEWNIMHREKFGSWKADVQHQIYNIQNKMTASVLEHPPAPADLLKKKKHVEQCSGNGRSHTYNPYGPRHDKLGPL